MSHVLAGRAVLSGKARGIAMGATHYFSPEEMDAHRAEDERPDAALQDVDSDALAHLNAWSFGAERNASKPGHAWIGWRAGINPWRLMLLKPMPIGVRHKWRYETARDVIVRGRKAKR
jgi:hypothetical protein